MLKSSYVIFSPQDFTGTDDLPSGEDEPSILLSPPTTQVIVKKTVTPAPIETPTEVSNLKVVLKDAKVYEYTSTDGSKKVVVTFTTVTSQVLTSVLPAPKTPTTPAGTPTSQLYTVETYESVDDVPTQSVPAIILSTPGTEIVVKKCAGELPLVKISLK